MIIETKTNSGIAVLCDRREYLDTVTVVAGFKAGARSESGTTCGISHFLEHMVFEGAGGKTATELAMSVEEVGGDVNAYTGHEKTRFIVRLPKQHLPRALTLLRDILTAPGFGEEELKREKEVVVQEIKTSEDDAADKVRDLLCAEAFKDSSLQHSIYGSEANVRAFTARDLRRFMNDNYRTGAMAVAMVGGIDPQEFTAAVAEAMDGGFPAGQPEEWAPAEFHGGGTVGEVKAGAARTVLTLAFEGVPLGEADEVACALVETALGGWMTSRLYHRLRTELGLCYSVAADSMCFKDVGMLEIMTGSTEPEKLLVETGKVLKQVVADGFTEDEFSKARQQMTSTMMFQHESAKITALTAVEDYFAYGRALNYEDLLAAYDRASLDSMNAMARRLFTGKPPVLAWTGPEKIGFASDEITGIIRR